MALINSSQSKPVHPLGDYFLNDLHQNRAGFVVWVVVVVGMVVKFVVASLAGFAFVVAFFLSWFVGGFDFLCLLVDCLGFFRS